MDNEAAMTSPLRESLAREFARNVATQEEARVMRRFLAWLQQEGFGGVYAEVHSPAAQFLHRDRSRE